MMFLKLKNFGKVACSLVQAETKITFLIPSEQFSLRREFLTKNINFGKKM
jgi:hypothetical protein